MNRFYSADGTQIGHLCGINSAIYQFTQLIKQWREYT